MTICKKLKSAKNIFELHKKMTHLINTAYFRLWLIKKKGKHGTYNLKVNVGKYSVWYMKKMWKWQCEFAESLLNHMSSLPMCQRGLRANVLAASVVYVLTCLCVNLPKAWQLLIFTYQRANKRANVPYGVPMFQLGMPTCQHSPYKMLREIFILYYCKKFYIITDIVVKHIISIWCIVHKN